MIKPVYWKGYCISNKVTVDGNDDRFTVSESLDRLVALARLGKKAEKVLNIIAEKGEYSKNDAPHVIYYDNKGYNCSNWDTEVIHIKNSSYPRIKSYERSDYYGWNKFNLVFSDEIGYDIVGRYKVPVIGTYLNASHYSLKSKRGFKAEFKRRKKKELFLGYIRLTKSSNITFDSQKKHDYVIKLGNIKDWQVDIFANAITNILIDSADVNSANWPQKFYSFRRDVKKWLIEDKISKNFLEEIKYYGKSMRILNEVMNK